MTAEHADRFKNQRRFDIENPITESRRCSGAPVVQFVGVQHHDLARHADLSSAAIIKRLDAHCRQADGVGVVAMFAIRGLLKPCLQEFHPVFGGRAAHPISGRSRARSFKTQAAGSATIVNHSD